MSQNFLFVCSANKQRSKTADDYFSSKFPELHFDSAGTNLKICQKEGTNALNDDMMEWADLVFVMENKHKELIVKSSGDAYSQKIVVLNIPDVYQYYQKELITTLEEKVARYF